MYRYSCFLRFPHKNFIFTHTTSIEIHKGGSVHVPTGAFLCFTGFCAGIIVAGGVSGLLIGLSIVPRYVGITHTADYIFLYEDISLLATVAETILTLFPVRIPLGPFFLAVCGVFFGIFLGGWILALAEIAKVFPVFRQTAEAHQGLSLLVIISIAAGKTSGSLFYYAIGWM